MLKNDISKVIGQSVFAVHCAQADKDSEINGILFEFPIGALRI